MTGPDPDRQDVGPQRRTEGPPAADVRVVRGGPDSVAKLSMHARRAARAFALDGEPLLGVSVFLALDDIGPASLRGLLAGRLASYRLVHVPTVGTILAAGFELLPTFARPHFTLRLAAAAEDELARLLAGLGPPEANPYHGGRRRPPRR